MEKTNITSKNFRAFVMSVLESQKGIYTSSLEEYLRSLWIVIEGRKDAQLSFNLVAEIIESSFSTQPAPFDPAWLLFEKPLHWNFRDNIYVIEALDGHEIKVVATDVDDYEILKHTLLFQIADLYRMRDNQLKNKYRYMGVSSPTGNSWYNFDVFTYLECGTRGMGDNNREGVESSACDWATLAVMLELGRIYE